MKGSAKRKIGAVAKLMAVILVLISIALLETPVYAAETEEVDIFVYVHILFDIYYYNIY